MPTLKELRQRKKTVGSIFRMASAMKMVSQSKYNRFHEQLRQARTICQTLTDLTGRLFFEWKKEEKKLDSLYLEPGPPEAPWLLVFMASDSGLCGGFNQRLVKAAHHFISTYPDQAVEVICLGQKGVSPLQKACHPKIIHVFSHAHAHPFPVIEAILSQFFNKRVAGCSLVYGKFYNILRQEPQVIQILPLIPPENPQGETCPSGLLSYEPSLKEALQEALHLLFTTSFYGWIKEHTLSEYGARMSSMESAKENANGMIQKLNLSYNHLRQALITKELIEIISGAEAT